MILGAEEAGLLTQVNDDKPKSAERSPFWRTSDYLSCLKAFAPPTISVISLVIAL